MTLGRFWYPRAVCGALALASALIAAGSTPAVTAANQTQTRADPPRLVVLVVVDQFRADYPQMYGQQWKHGLRRLFDRGAVFRHAAYQYGGSVTCPGHSTIGTGTLPFVHGMISNNWYDRATRRTILCSSDPQATAVPFGGGRGVERHGPMSLMAPTFADELRRQAKRQPNIVSISLKPRASIGLGGHGGPGTMIIWEEDNGTWSTSDRFTKTPWPEVDRFVTDHPIAKSYGQTWTKLLPEPAYLHADDAPGENTPIPWDRTFPHALESPSGRADNLFVNAWERSPWSDEYLADLAIDLIDKLKLGSQPGTDMLAVSFSALDGVGHEYGPRSHEVQDLLARLDVTIGRLLAAIERAAGTNYVLAFSADHGVATIPEQVEGRKAGRLTSNAIRQAAETAIAKVLESGSHVATLVESHLSLTPGTFDRLRAKPGAVESVKQAIAAVPGVGLVYSAAELTSPAATDDPMLRAWRLSYYPGRGGDFVVSPLPNFLARAAGTTHGTPYDYDVRVPVLLFGARIRTGQYDQAASPVDIAPTLASFTGVRLSQTNGRVLSEAIIR
ncbi:MAG TPA: alkaline phosphatase family protein [Vicinamibacterales bacterium]|nr:alkaline phosphatase family protein [Vicinamibacterales bacterium]